MRRSGFKGSTMREFDLFVIGAGSGGVRAARMAAARGLRVGICEDKAFGGTCVNVGCIPKKLFSYAAAVPSEHHYGADMGWSSVESAFDWSKFMAAKDKEIERLNGIYERILNNNEVVVMKGRGKLLGVNEVDVAGETVSAKNILVATGGRPFIPESGKDCGITSDEFFHLKAQPKSAVVVGGGYIGVELASILHKLGTETRLLYRGELFLKGFDDDVRKHLAEEMSKSGLAPEFSTDIKSCQRDGEMINVTLSSGETFQTEQVLYATGRLPNTEGLGLDNVGVDVDGKGAIVVDEEYRTSVKHIFAVGDVIDHINLTPVALAQGMSVVRSLMGEFRSIDLENVPTAVFSMPNIGTVGLGESDARAKYGEVEIFRSTFTPLKHTITSSTQKMLMKMIVDKASQKVVGMHMVGADAGEVIQGFAVAMRAGATKDVFDSTIGIHPTAAEEFVTMRTPVSL